MLPDRHRVYAGDGWLSDLAQENSVRRVMSFLFRLGDKTVTKLWCQAKFPYVDTSIMADDD